ncbi:MAG: ABC transporter substrate-binding protein [Burkholderiaceae bacterium]|jgi:peptide/nickel transport system substrate-binding protein|nr:ABC transporter substrate-binding protein [Burkholderiaceae bacterium]
MLNRRTLLTSSFASSALAAVGGLPLALPRTALAQGRKDTLNLGIVLEPTKLDPTAAAESSIAEVTLYNIYETLTKVHADGSVSALLAESWQISPDLRTYTFKLRKGVKFHNGEPFSAHTVKFAFERAGGDKSANKDKRIFANLGVHVVDQDTVVLVNKEVEPNLLFLLGQATAIMVEPKSADSNAARPIGTGPYQLESWRRGASLTLARWSAYRNASAIPIRRAVFKVIVDSAAQVTSLLAGDVDAFVRVDAARSMAQFKNDPRFQVIIAGSRAKTLMAINNQRKPFDDVRVRRALCAAVNRKAVIEGAAEGYGVAIGSHYVSGAPGYIDTTAINPYDPAKARALLQEAGIKTPLALTLTLPPTPYAAKGGEVIAAELAKAGIQARLVNVEWAQWMSSVYINHNYDLTLISHVEPFDLGNWAKPGYYWGYRSKDFDALYARIKTASAERERHQLLAQAQRLLATDAAACFLYQPQWITIADKRVRGLWKDMPLFTNDISALSWA